jgi:hypothetical protein
MSSLGVPPPDVVRGCLPRKGCVRFDFARKEGIAGKPDVDLRAKWRPRRRASARDQVIGLTISDSFLLRAREVIEMKDAFC